MSREEMIAELLGAWLKNNERRADSKWYKSDLADYARHIGGKSDSELQDCLDRVRYTPTDRELSQNCIVIHPGSRGTTR